jgi:hypothetical protein
MPETEKRAEATQRKAKRLISVRLRYAINTHLEDRGLTTPAAIGAAVGLSAAEAVCR